LVLSNQRLIEYSKVVIERNNDIKRRLQGLDLKGRSAVVQDLKSIIKDLDVLNRVNTSEKPQVADRLIQDKREQEHPHLKQLTKVEQRVYVLAQSDYRPKDIANMLGYSVQYVRNVKSRIRKKLDLDKRWGAD
jgi:DNA-binding CsgD family transcriptional regulator